MNYYNEFNPGAAAWLRELIADGQIPAGDVDERSIEDVLPKDLAGYKQCHFFAGIGGWSLALRIAGIPDDYPIWTGSCPCQPFSAAGLGKGADDPRHLWPAFRWLVEQCQPTVVAGEQVASKAGRAWLAGVRSDLETLGYAVGAADLCAAGVGAPHQRQRLFWLADAQRERRREWTTGGGDAEYVTSAGEDVWRGDYGRCADGKQRRVSPGVPLLVNGLPSRVEQMRGFGNAIVPQVAAEFLKAALI